MAHNNKWHLCELLQLKQKNAFLHHDLPGGPSIICEITGLPGFADEEAKLPKFTCQEADKLFSNTSFLLPKLQVDSLS